MIVREHIDVTLNMVGPTPGWEIRITGTLKIGEPLEFEIDKRRYRVTAEELTNEGEASDGQ